MIINYLKGGGAVNLDYTEMLINESEDALDVYEPSPISNSYLDITDDSIDGFSSSGTTAYNNGNITQLVLPKQVTSQGGTYNLKYIDDNAFYGKTLLTNLVLPYTVEVVGGDAFAGCTGLTKIKFSRNLKTLGEEAFYGCTSLTSIVLPATLTSIEDYAFANCSSLTSIEFKSDMPPTLGEDSSEETHVFDNTNDCVIYVPNGALSDYEAAYPKYASRMVGVS